MESKRRIELSRNIIGMLRKESDLEGALHVMGICSSYFLHMVPKKGRRDSFEAWVQTLYEAEFKLQTIPDDNLTHQLPD
jgi:hypothetical protein